MGRRRYNWTIVLHMVGMLLAGPLSINALADGFSDKQVQIDGIDSQGTLDDKNNLEFLGLGVVFSCEDARPREKSNARRPINKLFGFERTRTSN